MISFNLSENKSFRLGTSPFTGKEISEKQAVPNTPEIYVGCIFHTWYHLLQRFHGHPFTMNPKHITLTLIFLLNSKTVDAIDPGHLYFISVLLAPTQ